MANFADLTSMGCSKYSSTSKENGAQVSTVQSVFYGFDGRNTDSGAEAFIMVFDKATAPVSGTDVPIVVIEVGAAGAGGAGNFFYSTPATIGEKMTHGIYILASSTDFNGSTFTPLVSNAIFFHVQYAPEDGLTNP